MDDDDAARYPPNPSHSIGLHNRSSSSHGPKLPVRNPSAFSGNPDGDYRDDDDDDDAGEDDDESHRRQKPHQNRRIHKEEDEDDDDAGGGEYGHLLAKMSYEFAPRAKRTPPSAERLALADWTEVSTNALLDAWGERFVQLGRKSLRSDEWRHVAEKVAEAAKVRITDAQCRNRLDTLKKKYKKEKAGLAESNAGASRWVYFERMDSLMGSPPTASLPPPPSWKPLACGLDSGEYVFMKPGAFMDHADGIGGIGDSSESGSENREGPEEDDDDDSDPRPPLSKKARLLAARPQTGDNGEDENGNMFGMPAESIRRFREIYQRIENNKRQQMIELEKMRMEFQMELEVQRRQIFERAQAEMARIDKGDQDINGSVTHASG